MRKAFLLCAMMLTASVALAKDIKTLVVTTQPQMHCASCENKIKGNLRFVKGVKNIECDIEHQRITITYDADKTSAEVIIRSFEKFGYSAVEVKPDGEQNATTCDENIQETQGRGDCCSRK